MGRDSADDPSNLREVILYPTRQWGGEGLIGCGIGYAGLFTGIRVALTGGEVRPLASYTAALHPPYPLYRPRRLLCVLHCAPLLRFQPGRRVRQRHLTIPYNRYTRRGIGGFRTRAAARSVQDEDAVADPGQ